MNVKFKASARTTALHLTGAGRQRNPTAPVGGEVFSLDIPFHRTRMFWNSRIPIFFASSFMLVLTARRSSRAGGENPKESWAAKCSCPLLQARRASTRTQGCGQAFAKPITDD